MCDFTIWTLGSSGFLAAVDHCDNIDAGKKFLLGVLTRNLARSLGGWFEKGVSC